MNALIKKGHIEPLTQEELKNTEGLEKAYQSMLEREYGVGNIPDVLSPEDQATIARNFLDRINTGIECYILAKEMLIKLGYTEEELSEIRTTAAWDYGRTMFIARYSANIGYLQEEEAWKHMKTAAGNGVRDYSSWREYLAAYVLGRAIGYGDKSTDLYYYMEELLNSKKSPLNKVLFRQS